MSQRSILSFFKTSTNRVDGSEEQGLKDGKDGIVSSPTVPSGKAVAKRKKLTNPSTQKKKKRMVIMSDSEDEGNAPSSGEEFQPSGASQSSVSEHDECSGTDDGDSVELVKKKRTAASGKNKSSDVSFSSQKSPTSLKKAYETHGIGKGTLQKLSSFSVPTESPAADSAGPRLHQTLDFLQPDKIRDKEKRLRREEGYDSRTLYVPEAFKKTTTPAMRQWWELKEDHFDTILFFKMGKFYEFFHMDADVGVKELGLVYMKGGHAHAGFPEIAYGRYADTLLRKGYKIARIEQTETPDMMTDRLEASKRKVTKYDKVVKREICQITTPGTRTPNFMDGESLDSTSTYLFAIYEKPIGKGSQIGVCFVETSIGKVYLGQFDDDAYGSRLRTLISHYPPSQVLSEKKSHSPMLAQLFKTTLASVMKEYLAPGKEFWDAEHTLKVLTEADYFKKPDSDEVVMPDALKKMVDDCDTLSRTPTEGYELALKSLGAIVWYLRWCFLDQDILSLKSFQEYTPLDSFLGDQPSSHEFDRSKMVLDSVTLANLDVFVNQSTGSTEGSLIERLDNCKTAGGKRLLREWISAPLCNPKLINDRLDAIDDLMSAGDLTALLSDLRKLPDFERLLHKVHSLGRPKSGDQYPDSRAIMFEKEIYSKRKIDSFLSLLSGFRRALSILPSIQNLEMKSALLRRCVTSVLEGGNFPDISPLLGYFEVAFDQEAAQKAGAIHPAKGYVEEYDESVEEISSIQQQLQDYLKQQKKMLQSSQVSYVGTGRNRYQLEVPDSATKRVPSSYEVTGQRKGFKRYVTEESKAMLATLMEAEDRQVAALKDTMRKIFSKFDESYEQWTAAIQCINIVDVLQSLTTYSMASEGDMCRPELLLPHSTQPPVISIKDGRHPCSVRLLDGEDFIPNDTSLGCLATDNQGDGAASHLMLLTGPNMGGKSTLMRQVGLIAILSQLGCYVPARKVVMTPIDRVFTRLGATDRIMYGESTFFVELTETGITLQHASRHSLVLLDELGRGTSTHDGTAIASAVVRELAERIRCRTIFSTHYHCLVEDFVNHNDIQLSHMACLVHEPEDDADDQMETITFLYKLASNFCPKSYGFNVAKLAGLPDEVISLGLNKARQLEALTEARRCIRLMLTADDQTLLRKVRSIAAV